MNRLKHLFSFTAIFFFFVIGSASYGVRRMTFTPEGGQIPREFNKFKDTLLVIRHSDDWGYDHYLKKNFRENYNGPYKIINPWDLKNYPIATYQYVFDHSSNYSSKTTTTSTPITAGGHVMNGGSNISSHTTTYASSDVFLITDRRQKKDYVTKSSSAYSKLMRAYIKALDAYRSN